MIAQELTTKVSANNLEKRVPNATINDFVKKGGWKIKESFSKDYIWIQSNMKGFDEGRYTILAKPLKNKHKGHDTKIAIYYTPYGHNLVWVGYVKDSREIENAIAGVNSDLLDVKRFYNG